MEIERETMACLVSGYAWRWAEPLKVVASEQAFQLRLKNPATGAPSTIFDLAGKIDGIIEVSPGRLAVLEHKFLGTDIAIESDVWRRLQLDSQVSIYINAARELGYDVATVLYDCIRKPTIKPTAVPVTDDLGAKIVLDGNGKRVQTAKGEWRQTGDTDKGFVLQTRDCTAEEWTAKLMADIGKRPNQYYCRHEVPRLDSDLKECRQELWELQQTIRQAENTGRWFKTVSFSTCPNCPYFGFCTSKYNPSDPLPAGFSKVVDLHPELKGE
jgi:hypothetical protein